MDIDVTQDISSLSYEASRDLLVSVVRALENGQQPLDESMKLWEFGEKLASRCEEFLRQAQEKFRSVTAPQDEDHLTS